MWVKSWMKSALRAPEGEGAGGDAPAPAAPTAGQDAAPKVPSSLLDVDLEADTTVAPASDGGTPADADAAGKSQRPEWLPEQFWDAQKGAQWEKLAQSHQDLRRQLGKGDHKPPASAEAYALPKPAEGQKTFDVPADDPALSAFRAAAHKMGLSQGQFEGLVGPVLSVLAEVAGETAADTPEARQAAFQAEIQKLGKAGASQIKAIKTWGEGLREKGVFSPAEWDEFRLAAGTADGVRMLSKLREMSGERAIPIDVTDMGNSDGSLSDYYAMTKHPEYLTSAEMQKKARLLLERLDKEGRIPKTGGRGFL